MKKILILLFFIGTLSYAMTPETITQDNQDEIILNNLLDGVWSNLDELEASWDRLNNQLNNLSTNNATLKKLLDDSAILITKLREELNYATEGVNDALENWAYMETLLTKAENTANAWERETIVLKRKVRNQPFVVGGVAIGFGVGGTFLGMGINQNNGWNNNMTIGVTTMGVTAVVYFIGNKVFKWW